MQALVNGRRSACLDPGDRGLHYGDGLFETIAIQRGRPRWLDRHLARLQEGARRLGMPPPDGGQLRREIDEVCRQEQGVLKILLTRGAAERGYRPPRQAQTTRIVAALPWPALDPSNWTEGVKVRNCRLRLGRNPALAGLKHLNRLEQVLASAEWDDAQVAEGLMMDDRDQVIGGTRTNLFARIAGRWITPSVDQCGVAGVMRQAFREWTAAQGDPVVERAVPAAELGGATALLLTNALIGAWPVREFEGIPLPVDPQAVRFNAWVARQ